MKLLLRFVGAIALLLIFAVVYLLTTNIAKRPDGPVEFTDQPQTLGQLGGFHLLDDIKIEAETEADFTRIAILTHLNRGTTLEGLETPRVEATTTEESVTLTFLDTAFSEDSQNEYLRTHRSITVNYPGRAQEVTLTRPNDQDSQEVVIRLDQSAKYRLTADPQNAGIVWVDILK